MFDKIVYDLKDNFLKVGIRSLISSGEHTDLLHFKIQGRYRNYQQINFTDNIFNYINESSIQPGLLLVNCDNSLNIHLWTWLPENIVNWHDIFLVRKYKYHVCCGEKRNRALSHKEGNVLALFAAGRNRLEISAQLNIPVRTINDLKLRGMGKLGISSNKELIVWGRYNGILN